MSDLKDLNGSLILFERDFQLDKSQLKLESSGHLTYDTALSMVVRVVDDLLENDFQKLVNILYRIDVSESKLKEALAQSSDNHASIIAKMILDRELEKVETRKRYSNL